MPDLLLELFSEEIPARMQARAAADLKRLVTDALVARGLVYDGAAAFATPRRLALHVAGIPVRQPDTREEKKGPRVGAPEAAVQGFLKSAGLASLADATMVKDAKKGEFYTAVIERPGRAALEVLGEVLPAIIRGFPWPKSMRWGRESTRPDSLRWVRPLHSIVATFGPETEEPDIVAFAIDGVVASNVTRGHRFLSPAAFKVRRFDDYVPALEKAKVVLDAERRKNIILHDARDLAFAQGLELIEDEALLDEVAGLVEWPVVLIGEFDAAFLEIPPEVIRATIRANQKCFVLRGTGGALANKFILVSNIDASDGSAAIAAGNARVVRARLSDAKFFWESDLKIKLEDRLPKLDTIVFHEKLGTQGERVKRIEALARELAPIVGTDPDRAARAARLAKADLVSEMVGEFPELQGLMGRYYATHQGEDASVAAAIEEHYKPQGPSDRVPSNPVSIAVALADKIDTLVGFWAIDEKPTGSKDPYALRRAALGVIRIVLENKLSFDLRSILEASILEHYLSFDIKKAYDLLGDIVSESYPRGTAFPEFSRMILDLLSRSIWYKRIQPIWLEELELITKSIETDEWDYATEHIPLWLEQVRLTLEDMVILRLNEIDYSDAIISHIGRPEADIQDQIIGDEWYTIKTLRSFFADRLKVYLRDGGARHDLIDAVYAVSSGLPSQIREEGPMPDDLLMIVRRVEALGKFLDTDDGKNLLAGYRRAANILRIEEKKDGAGAFDDAPDESLMVDRLEKYLWRTIQSTAVEARSDLKRAQEIDLPGDQSRAAFESAMESLSTLRTAIDAFFEGVTVNVAEQDIRSNRLRLLNEFRRAVHEVADFSKIAG